MPTSTNARLSQAQTKKGEAILTAKLFIESLKELKTAAALVSVQRFFRHEDGTSDFIGVRMGELFKLAKANTSMPLSEVEKLLKHKYYEARMAALCIMDFKAREKKITDTERKALFDLYIKNHEHINNWDMVDRAAPHVVGGYLANKPRAILYKLAKSKNVWERRTAIVSTWFFIRQNDLDDFYKIATLLVNDQHDLIQKAVGSWAREAGKKDKGRLLAFLDEHAATMPRVTLRYAIEKLDKKTQDSYMKMRKALEK